MTDNSKPQYRVSIGEQTQLWDADKYERNKEKLNEKYPEAKVEQVSLSSAENEQVKPGQRYLVTIGEQSQEWDSDKLNRNKGHLLQKYPDAKIQSISAYKGAPSDEPKEFGKLTQVDNQVFKEGLNQSYLMDDELTYRDAETLKKQEEEQRFNELLSTLDKDEAEYLKALYGAGQAREALERVNRAREAGAYTRRQAREKRNAAEESLEQSMRTLNNNPYYLNELKETVSTLETQGQNIENYWKQFVKDNPIQQVVPTDPEELSRTKQSRGTEADKKEAALMAAMNFNKQAINAANAPLRYDDSSGFANFGKGAADKLSDPAFWSINIERENNMALRKALQKIQDASGRADELGKRVQNGDLKSILTDEELMMVEAYVDMQNARAKRAYDTARMYKAGESAAVSAEFMLEMALTAGLGGGIKKGTAKAVGKYLFKQTGKMAAETFAEKALKWGATKGAKLVAGQAGNILSAAARTPFMWSNADKIAEHSITVDDNGQLVGLGTAIMEGGLDTLTEVVTEGMGTATTEAIGSALNVVGVGKIMNVLSKTKPGEIVGKVHNAFTNSKLAKAVGFDGLAEEMLEEMDAAVFDQVRGNPDALRDFFKMDNILTTLASFAPLTLGGGAVTMGRMVHAEKQLESAEKQLSEYLKSKGYEQEQIAYYLDVTKGATPKQLSEVLAPIVNEIASANSKFGGSSNEVRDNVAAYEVVKKYALAAMKSQALNGAYKEQQAQQREDKKAELEQKYGTFYQTPTATNEKTGKTWETSPVVETATLNDGRTVFINSAPTEDGQMAATDGQGNHIFISENDIATTADEDGNVSQLRAKQSLDGYLSYLIMQNKKRAENARINEETNAQKESLAEQYSVGSNVNIGTEEAPIMGVVMQQTPDGVVVQTEEGQVRQISYAELGEVSGTPIGALTDQEIDEEEARQLGLEDEEYAKLKAFYNQYGQFWSNPREENGEVVPPMVRVIETGNGTYTMLALSMDSGEVAALSQDGKQVTIKASDITSTTKVPLSEFLRNDQFVSPTIVAEAENEEEAVVEETPTETSHTPMNEDGTVNETAFWNNDPAGWAKWNDEKRQDGGANSIAYINQAIQREQAAIQQLQSDYDKESDFEKRATLEQQIDGLRQRLAPLMALQQQYQSAQQTQSQEQNQVQPSIVKANAIEMAPEQLANLDKTYNDIYNSTKSASEKVRILQEYLNQISNGSVPIKVLTKQNYEQVMRDAGCSEKQIAQVGRKMQTLKPGQAIAGFQASGCCFVMTEGTPNIDMARSTYVHERQHLFNNNDPRYVNALASLLGSKENAISVLAALSDVDTALQYENMELPYLANEIICRAMESAYKYQNFSVDLQNKGVPAEVITLIEKLDNEQRNTPNLSLPRRYDNVDGSRYSDSTQDDRNKEQISRGILGQQGLGSIRPSERGDGVGETGVGVEEAVNASPDEDIIKRGTDFRITKTPDSNGLSYEQTDAIEKTAGELEYGDDESAATQFSIVAIAEGVGLNVVKDDGEGNVAFVAPSGMKYDANNPITAEDIKSIPDTPFGYMMADAKAIGNVSPSKEWVLWKKYALMLNAFLEKGSAENGGIENLQGTWQFIADTVYKTVATNSDSQYSYSLDITRVCKKNEAVINAISEMQRRLGYGITPGQIMDIYLSTIEAGYQVPCPVCYVFSRYIRNGKYATIMINGQRKYGSQLVDPRTLTEKQKKERIAYWLAEKERIEAENEANKSAIAKANEDITILLKEIDALSKQITDPKSNLSEEQKAEMLEKIHAMDARYRAALNVVSQSSLDSWITQFAIYQKKVDGKMQWFLYEDTYKGFPDEAALDMRMTSTAMRLYPAIQRYRNSRGSGAGKEITFVSNNDIGDVPMALGSNAATKDLARPADISDEEFEEMKKSDEYADLKLGVKNLYRQAAEEGDPKKKAALLKKARERFASASKYARQQSLRGGQRMWSWSDNIERLAPDVFINLMQMEMLGGALQSYSKQLEGIKLVASMNGYVNGSLMGKGNGYREVSEDEIEMVDGKAYVKDADFVIAEPGKKPVILKSPAYKHTDGKWYTLEFDDVVGIDAFGKDEDGHHFKGLFDLNAQYDKAGNILVGMNDLHIRMAMMDDRIFFIIPWHSSGANQHILAQMYDYLGVEYDVKESQDYTDVQGEKRYKAFGEKSEEKETKDGKKKKEEAKITEHLINFWVDHYENAREVAGYGKVAGKDFDCGIKGGIENSDGNGFISASQAHYRELRDAIFNGIKVQTGVDKKGKPTYTNMNVEDAKPEWFNEIMNDEFLRQVFNKVRSNLGEDGRMTSGDSKSIYPYEYWDETSTFDTADINGIRYLEYCRRLGYKPKFCGKLDGKPAKDFGNFADDKGYWKTLIDRRMYGVDKKFQDLTPVTAENFTTDLVDPVETAKEFIVTTVADERGTQTIVDSALAMEESRGGVATVDYDLSMQEALDAYNGVDFKITEENFPEVSEKIIADMQKEIKDVQFSIIGEVAALRDNTSEGVQRLNNLAVARDMESQLNPDWSTRDNAEAMKIKVATGWERGADGLWRYEVADPKLRNPNDWLYKKKKLTIKDIVEDSELLRLYPTIGDIDIKKMTSKYDWGASYVAGKNLIELPFGALKDEIKKYVFWDEEVKQRKIWEKFLLFYGDLLHEMQHAIQHREGFARGGTPATVIEPTVLDRFKELEEESNQITAQWNALPKAEQVYSNPVARNLSSKSYDIANEVKRLMRRYRIGDSGYKRLAGENEANNAIRRMPFTLEQRRQTLLSATEDVDRANQIVIFRDVLGEGESVQFSIRTNEQKEKLFDAAKEHYGVTKNFNAAGYMLPDGSLLDFSEANDGGNPNERSLDHRDIEGVIMDEGTEYESRWMYIADFLNEGAIRMLPESAGINLSVAPTAEQRSKLFDFMYKYGGEVILEISDDRMNSVAYVEYNRGTAPARIFRDIDGYFRDGIIPQQDVQFKIANDNQRIFVSNAAKAVESIQMGKATPEQWLKMIEKNGGLKAGEDKWMGLSDWLKSSDKKTLTKEEVLDFINENMIQIEEQHYSNTEMGRESVRVLNEKYPGWEDAFSFDWDGYMEEPYADVSNNEAAVELYNKYHEDSVELDEDGEFEDMETEEKVRKFGKELADIFYGSESVVRGIHGTREGYTTRGLTNNHEIALTVPTIESWGATDAIHFGDAGNGRAVAWIRFGETTTKDRAHDEQLYEQMLAEQEVLWKALREKYGEDWQSKMTEADKQEEKRISEKYKQLRRESRSKILVIDEIQSKRHQEGREQGYSRTEEYKKALARKQEADKAFTEYANYLKEKYGVNEYGGIRMDMLTEEEEQRRRELFAPLAEAQAAPILTLESGIPEAPFEKNWHELAMKRMLRYAAENGYDVIAWTKGDQQAERYNLGGVISEIKATKYPRGYEVVSFGKNGSIVHNEVFADENAMVGVYGKEMAQRIIESVDALESSETATISGDNLRVGGEGMKGFYDKMLPSFMNKYGKKWGIKVSDMELPNLENGLTMHSIPVTDEMKQSVMEEGQVMFKIRGANESAMDFAQQTLADFRKEYNVPAITTVVDINDREALAAALGYTPKEFTDEMYNDILAGYEQGGSAFYERNTRRIAIFAKESIHNSVQMHNHIFHENTHWLEDEHPEILELGEWLWQNSEPELRRKIKEAIIDSGMYEGEEAYEMLAAYVGYVMSHGKADVAFAKTPSELQKHWELIFNAFGYEPRGKEIRRRGTGDNSGRVGSLRDRRDAEAEMPTQQSSIQDLTAEERRIIGEYFPEFNKSEDVRMRVNSQGKELTEGQEEFFANSKAVDKDGNLLVLYHGTPRAGFTEFKSGWFTTSKEDAISYSGDRKGRLFDPDEKYEPETLTAGDFRLGYMTFDSEEDRAAFLERFPYADEVMSEREYEDARMGAEDEEYDALTARRKEFAEVWNAYREYERERFVDTTIGDLIANPEAYTEEDLMRAMLEYDSNASLDSFDDMSAEERKDALVSALQNANEETEGGILDMVIPTRVPRNGDGVKHNDLSNRTYEVYANVENPYEIDANGRGSEFESGDIYKAVEETLKDKQYDGIIIRNWRVGRYQELGDVVVPKYGEQIKLTSNESPTGSAGVQFKVVTDPKVIEEFEAGEKAYAWRSAYINEESEVYSPMASRLKPTATGTKQQKNEAAQMGQIDQAVENPDMVDEKGHITILDEDGGKNIVAYNPYDHCCINSMMNDQFKRAWKRDNLFVVRVSYPKSEETSGYHAYKAKDPVGIKTDWKAGAVGQKLPESKRRHIMLTRWMKNLGVEKWEKVANDWIKTLEGENIDVPFNCVPRKVLNFLADAGVNIVAPESGMPEADAAYEEWKKDPIGYVGDTELPPHIKALNESVGFNPDEGVNFKVTGTPTSEVVEKGLQLSLEDFSRLAGNIFRGLPEEMRAEVAENASHNNWDLQGATFQIATRLAEKEELNNEEEEIARMIADNVTDAVVITGIEMTRPFTTNEALWMLYQSNNPVSDADIIGAAREAVVAKNLGFDATALRADEKLADDVNFKVVNNAAINASASLYNQGAVDAITRLKESFVDMNASVESLVETMEKNSGKKAEGFENILMALNQQSSKGLAAMEKYERLFLEPMFEEIRQLMKATGKSYDDIVRYVILKHGLERNDKFAKRDAKEFHKSEYDQKVASIDADKSLSDAEKQARLSKAENAYNKAIQDVDAGVDAKYNELREKDYSGLSSMFYDQLGVDRKNYNTEEEYQSALMSAKKNKYDSLADIESAAQNEVSAFEKATSTDGLWNAINKATKEILRQQYQANMISKEQYESLKDMFEYYVPLRGFKDNTAEDMYMYYRTPNSTGYTKPILAAEGRKTEAESPFGWIASMASSAIASNVKNEAKLALYYFVSNRPNNGIATISTTWFMVTGVDALGRKIFTPAYPPFVDDLSSDGAKQALEQWQQQMRDLRSQGLAYESKQNLNLGNAVVNIDSKNKPEHIVNVKVGGKDYTIIINGNPRAAQAINGDLNIEATGSADFTKFFGPILRWMASVNTSYNPEFWITNMMRDMFFTGMAANVKGDATYQRKFAKNYAKALKVISLNAKQEKGRLGNTHLEQMYKEFVENGGITGFTQIKDNAEWEREIENYMKSANAEDNALGKAMGGVKKVFHAMHRFGESLEQVSRFAAFLTAKEMGYSTSEAINDAKEITVNFNRKGSGKMISLEEAKHLVGRNGKPLNQMQQWAVVGFSSIAPLGRRCIMFFNAAIQGLNASYKLWQQNKIKTLAWVSGYLAIGVMNALLHALMDDDDDYLDMPQYERYNSLLIGKDGIYFKWALPQEMRAFYGLGQLAVEKALGRNPHQNVVVEAGKIMTEVLPLNPSEGWKAFTPSWALPGIELLINEDYKGTPIYNEQKWLSREEVERSAKWASAYKGTGAMYINIAKVLNNITGGDKYNAGIINLQPEKMEYIVQSAFGGTIRTADKFITAIANAINPEEEVALRQTPFLNRVLTLNDERYRNSYINDVYDYYAAEAEHTATLIKKYKNDKDLESIKDLQKSDEYKIMKIHNKYKKRIKDIKEKIKLTNNSAERKQLMAQQDELKRMVIKEVSEM